MSCAVFWGAGGGVAGVRRMGSMGEGGVTGGCNCRYN